MIFLLVHSPLVGPSTWLPVARELVRRGHGALVPSLLGAADAPPPHWRHCVSAVREQVGKPRDPIVLVGHSGAGLLLPAIADCVSATVSRLLFVDSGIPVRTGETPVVPQRFIDELATLAVGGRLPPWSKWWGEDAMSDLIPDEGQRDMLAAEMPSVSLDHLRERIPSPAGWDRVPCGYLLLSDAYIDAAAEARERGWRVEHIIGAQHLHIVVAPGAVTDALLRLAE